MNRRTFFATIFGSRFCRASKVVKSDLKYAHLYDLSGFYDLVPEYEVVVLAGPENPPELTRWRRIVSGKLED